MNDTGTSPRTVTAHIATELRVEMARKRLRQSDAAGALSMNRMLVSRRLAGDTNLTVGELTAFCRWLGISAADVLDRAVRAAREEVA